jgi:hypothetical protein
MPAKGNVFLKKANLETEFTPELIRELHKCSVDPIYFLKNYVKIQHPVHGSIPFKLYDYQEEIINCIHNNKDSLILTARQMGKTTTIAMYLLWFSIFNFDKTVLIASKDNSHAIDIQDRIKYAYEELPDWLKPGIVWYNRHSMKFDNGSQIVSSATTEKTGRGYSISFLYLDEFAFINPRIQTSLWSSIAPTLATGGACVISSTPNGDSDLFANLWRGSLAKLNTFANVEVKWDRHPDRDEKWKAEMLGKLGELQFRQECENEFLSSDSLLFNSIKLNSLSTKPPIMIDNGIAFWKEQIGGLGKTYLVGIDICKGSGNDFSTIEVLEFPSMEQIAEYRTNDILTHRFYDRVKYLLNKLSLPDKNGQRAEVIWSFENNGLGEAFAALYNVDDNPPEYAELVNSDQSGKHLGMVTTGKNKIISCLQFKSLVEKIKNNLTINSNILLFEMKNFVASGGSYAAKAGATDDLISAMLIIMQLLKRMAEYDQKAYETVYKFDENYYDPTSDIVDNEEIPIPFAIN